MMTATKTHDELLTRARELASDRATVALHYGDKPGSVAIRISGSSPSRGRL